MANDPFFAQVLKDQRTERLTQAAERRLLGVTDRVKSATAMVRRDQLLAAITLPFVIVAAMAFSVVIKEIVLDLLPDTIEGMAGMQIVVFLLGVALAIGTLAVPIFWVKTGGFGVFE